MQTDASGLAVMILAVYFLPAIIAKVRHHSNTMPILLLNVFLGWTILGWLGALIWCATAQATPPKA